MTDPLNNITQMFYDEAGNKRKEIDAEGKEKLFEYDVRDNLIELKDSKENATRFEYDKNNRLTKEVRPIGEETSYPKYFIKIFKRLIYQKRK